MTESSPSEPVPDPAPVTPAPLSSTEVGKDAVQSALEAAATTVGEVAVIVTNAVREVATAIGGLMTEVFEIQEASRKARAEGDDSPSDD